MIVRQRFAPVVRVPLCRPRGIPRAVRAIIGARGLAGMARPPGSRVQEVVGFAVDEVLSTVFTLCGDQDPDTATIELWLERELAVVAVRFAGQPLPRWLLANWDRATAPAVLLPPTEYGWGWTVVREALESASQVAVPGGHLLLLEMLL